MVFLGLKASPCLLQTYLWSLWPNNSIFVSFDHITFLLKAFSLSMWSAANFSRALMCCFWSKDFLLAWQPLSPCRCKARLTVDTDTCVPSASISLQTCFLVVVGWLLTILTNFLSAAGDSLRFLHDRGSDTTMPCSLYLQLFSQLILGPVAALKWLQVTFLTCSSQWSAFSDPCWAPLTFPL